MGEESSSCWAKLYTFIGALFFIIFPSWLKFILIVIKTLPRDLKLVLRYLKVRIHLLKAVKYDYTIGDFFNKTAKKYPHKICFYFQEEQWTFTDVKNLSSKIGNYFASQGFKKGDSVALVMENRPEYVCIWLGLSKIGVITGFINHNLRLNGLQHCIQASSAKAIIYSPDLNFAIQEVREMEGSQVSNLPQYCFGYKKDEKLENAFNINSVLDDISESEPIPSEKIKNNDKFCYIYTSGTTGLPKAAVIKHYRALMTASGVTYMNGVRPDDVVYTPVPLYHVQGGIIGISQALIHGSSVVIIKKFSASRFWKDCIKYNATISQYLGELCRYLLNQPVSPEDKKHKIRMMFGNGVRPELWQTFLDRFNNPKICELYGSTEGNSNMVNITGKVGAIGFFPIWAKRVVPSILIRVDPCTGEPLLNKKGFSIPSKIGEEGELIARIGRKDPIKAFDGYTDPKSTEKKILKNVFKKGDSYFRSGDILVQDQEGYFYFRDRTGDTFRWKGENVSTSEVEGILGNLCNLCDVVVYGVIIPNTDGRAGMATIQDGENKLNFETLSEGVIKVLPSYARPIFIRVINEISITGTFKLQKLDLQKEGYNIERITDKIYFWNNGKYTQLTKEFYDKINLGQMRL